jgi:calcineurin-like phosphoesterase
MPHYFTVAKGDPTLSGVVLDVDEKTGKARRIERIRATDQHRPQSIETEESGTR